jgi:cysteine sulfinate desulfinase/cysteine desulfurase-like protein
MATRIWTAAELEQMTPTQRHSLFESSIVTDLDQAPAELVERARARVESLIEAAEGSQPA